MNHIKPLIGITSSLRWESITPELNIRRVVVPDYYIDSVIRAGGIPLVLPVTPDSETARGMVGAVDGLLVTGGEDINPLLYGEEPLPKQGGFMPMRDDFEMGIIRHAHELGKPILGICRGIQAINVAFGGTLWQDVTYHADFTLKHFQESAFPSRSHTVSIKGGALGELFGKGGQASLPVNSLHHQAVNRVAEGFEVTATAADGVIEAIEKTSGGFVLGVQWHPEAMAAVGEPDMLSIFERFLAECDKK